jgi:hypothetical protein
MKRLGELHKPAAKDHTWNVLLGHNNEEEPLSLSLPVGGEREEEGVAVGEKEVDSRQQCEGKKALKKAKKKQERKEAKKTARKEDKQSHKEQLKRSQDQPDAAGQEESRGSVDSSSTYGSSKTPVVTLTVDAESDNDSRESSFGLNSNLSNKPCEEPAEIDDQYPSSLPTTTTMTPRSSSTRSLRTTPRPPARRCIIQHFGSVTGFNGGHEDAAAAVVAAAEGGLYGGSCDSDGVSTGCGGGSIDSWAAGGMMTMTASPASPTHRATAEYHHKVTVDAKRARTKHILSAVLASNNPLSSTSWWFLKHPITRLATTLLVTLLNLFSFVGDPASFSPAKAHGGLLLGHAYHGLFDPDKPSWLAARLGVMLLLGAFGAYVGLLIQQKVLRDSFQLVMFGFDNGMDCHRNPLAEQDGAVFAVACTVGLCWFGGMSCFAMYLDYIGVEESHQPNGGMHQVSYASYQLATAGIATFVRDWFVVVAVADQMLQVNCTSTAACFN